MGSEALLAGMNQLSEESFCKLKKYVLERQDNCYKEIKSTATTALNKILTRYESMHRDGEVGALAYIQISFMRTSLVDDYPVYHIDCYDERWFACLAECGGYWAPEFVTQAMCELKQGLIKQYGMKSSFESHDLMKTMVQFAEQVNQLILRQFAGNIKQICHAMDGASNHISVHFGEYFQFSDDK